MKLGNESHRRRRYSVPSVAILTAGALFLGLVLMLASIPWIARIPPGSGELSAPNAGDISFDASASINGSGVLTVFIDAPIGNRESPEPDVQVNMPEFDSPMSSDSSNFDGRDPCRWGRRSAPNALCHEIDFTGSPSGERTTRAF